MRPSHLAGLAAIAALGLPAVTGAAPEPPKLGLPIACEIGKTCEIQSYVDRDPGPGVRDYKCKGRTYEAHSGIDFRVLDMAAERAGVNVLAAAPGRVARLRDGVADISIRTPGAPSVEGQHCGNGVVIDHGDGWETQYCHMAKGSVRVKVGDVVAAGAPLGHVGLSGDTEFPHVHLTVRHAGQTIDPFAPDMSNPAACQPQATLWTPQAARQLAYKAGAVLNAGFAGGPLTGDAVEAGGVPAPGASSPYVVAYVRLIGLEAGDRLGMALSGPGGASLAKTTSAPMDHDKAQYFSYVGGKRPAAGWPHGTYTATFTVQRGGAVVITRQVQTTL